MIPNHAQFLPDSKRLLLDGHEPGHFSRVYLMNLEGGQPRAITPEGFSLWGVALSPDGKQLAVRSSDGIALVPVDGGEPQIVRNSQPGDLLLRWARDGTTLLVGERGETSCPVSRLDVQSGARTIWKTFSVPDSAGITSVACGVLAADDEHYVFGYVRSLSDLFLVEHLK